MSYIIFFTVTSNNVFKLSGISRLFVKDSSFSTRVIFFSFIPNTVLFDIFAESFAFGDFFILRLSK